MNRLPIILWSLASLGCNALAEFPEQPEPNADLDMQVSSDLGTADASSDLSDSSSFDGVQNMPDLDSDAGFVPQPVAFEFCPSGALRSRPRISVVGTKLIGAAVWVDPEEDLAKIQTIGGLNRTLEYPETEGVTPDLSAATSVDVGFDIDGEEDRFFFSVTRRHSPEFGIALYPTPICQQQCDASDILWNTSVTSTLNMVYESVRVDQREQRFWLGTEGDRVQMYMLGPDGTVGDQRSTSFCRRDEAACMQPGPLEADSFGTTFETVFVRAGDGTVRAWNRGGVPAPVIIDGEPVLYDDFAAIGERRSTAGEEYVFAHLDRDEDLIRTYRATRIDGNVARFSLVPVFDGAVEATNVWRVKLVGSGDGIWHLVATSENGFARAYLYTSNEGLVQVREQQLTPPGGTLRNWDASASPIGSTDENATLYIAYIAGDECAVDVTTHSFTIARQR